MSETHYLTPEGLEKLKKELEESKTIKRKEIASKIQAAIEMGDLSENAAYHDAKDEQAFLEGRIREIENILNNAEVIDESQKKKDEVIIGSKVVIECEGKKMEYVIVGSNEANPLEGKISNESPIGQALLGKKKKEKVQIAVPKGVMDCVIKSVE